MNVWVLRHEDKQGSVWISGVFETKAAAKSYAGRFDESEWQDATDHAIIQTDDNLWIVTKHHVWKE